MERVEMEREERDKGNRRDDREIQKEFREEREREMTRNGSRRINSAVGRKEEAKWDVISHFVLKK